MEINGYPLEMVPWNIFLALIPCWIVYFWANHRKIPFVIQFVLFVAWFFFLPNTSYLLTEVRHLLGQCENYDYLKVCADQAWMIPVFFIYALTGVPTFIYALRKMSQILHAKWLPVIMIPIAAVGTLFGLIERFNSWDVVRDLPLIIRTGFSYFTDPTRLTNWLVFTAVLYVIYYLFTPLFRNVSHD